MLTREAFLSQFLEKLDNDNFVKDNQPNSGQELTKEYLAERVESFNKVLDSGIIDEIVK